MNARVAFDEYYVKDLNEYNSIVQTLISEHQEIYFRGVTQACYNLEPSIARNLPAGFVKDNELELFKAFCRRQALYKSETYRDYTSMQFNLETLAIAQHHGLKTRLLDWSTNPLATLWFACEMPKQPLIDLYCIVWVLIAPKDKRERDRHFVTEEEATNDINEFFDKGKTKLYIPNIVNARIKNQSGIFTVHHFDITLQRYISLEENETFFYHRLNGQEPDLNKNWELIKILIKREPNSKDILENLRRFDVHMESIYPNLDSLAKRLNADFEAGYVL